MVQFLSITLFPSLMIVAGAGDVLSFRIPNWLTALLAAAFFPMALVTAMPLTAVGVHIAVGFGLFALGFVLFSLGLFGGGDAKLLAAAGLWLGWPGLLQFMVMTVFAGGLLAVAVGAWTVIHMDMEIRGSSLFDRFNAIKPKVPYGYAFAVGALLAFPHSWWTTGTS